MRTERRIGPEPIGTILGEMIARRGLARVREHEQLEGVWREAVGQPAARHTRVGAVRRGVLEVLVSNSVLLQELAGFRKQELLGRVRRALNSDAIRDLRFRLDQQTSEL